jgi:hypothetical protein
MALFAVRVSGADLEQARRLLAADLGIEVIGGGGSWTGERGESTPPPSDALIASVEAATVEAAEARIREALGDGSYAVEVNPA